MPSEFAPPGGKPRVTKKQIQQMQDNYRRAGELLKDTSELEAEEKSNIDELFEQEFDEAFVEQDTIGVYIGRFQPLQKGHENVLAQMLRENSKLLVFIGTGGDLERNPFSFEQVHSFFGRYISDTCIIQELADLPENIDWVKSLLSMISPHLPENCSLRFYGGDLKNDYAIQVLKELFPQVSDTPTSYIEIPRDQYLVNVDGQDVTISATACREALAKKDWDFLEQVLSEEVYELLKSTD